MHTLMVLILLLIKSRLDLECGNREFKHGAHLVLNRVNGVVPMIPHVLNQHVDVFGFNRSRNGVHHTGVVVGGAFLHDLFGLLKPGSHGLKGNHFTGTVEIGPCTKQVDAVKDDFRKVLSGETEKRMSDIELCG